MEAPDMKQKPPSRTQRKRSSTKSVLRLPEAKDAVLFSLGAAIARPILTQEMWRGGRARSSASRDLRVLLEKREPEHHDPVKLLRATVHSKKAVKEKRDRVSCGLLLQKSRLGYDTVVLAG